MSFFWVCLKGIYINDEKLLFKEMGIDKEEIGNEVLSALGKKKKKRIFHIHLHKQLKMMRMLNKFLMKNQFKEKILQ